MGSPTDWNRTAVQRLILDAEDTLSALDDAMKQTRPEELARAIRNGHRAYKELFARRGNHMLTPLSALALERLLAAIKEKINAVRQKLMYPHR